MADSEKVVKYDVNSFDAVTAALRQLINSYPGLSEGDEIAFAVLGEDTGKAMFPASGAVIESETRNIIGDITQICLYPFNVVYKTAGISDTRKANVKEWLDGLGRWLEKQPVTIGGQTYTLDAYPALTGSREFLAIERSTPAYLDSIEGNKAENWVIAISARYRNIIYKPK